MEEKRCWNCVYFNGNKGDEVEFCDKKELHVHDDGCCYMHVKRREKEEID